MFVNYFIKRPVFATVCALIMLLFGAVSIPTLPVAQYPDISPHKLMSLLATLAQMQRP